MILIPMRPIRPASFSPTPATPSTLLLTMSGSKGPLMFKDPLIDANRKRFGPFLLEPLEPRCMLDGTSTDPPLPMLTIPEIVSGHSAEGIDPVYQFSAKGGQLYHFKLDTGDIRSEVILSGPGTWVVDD